MFAYGILVLCLLSRAVNAQQIVNGQIYTPGIAIVDAPQPNTPLGGGKHSQSHYSGETSADKKRLLASCARRVVRWPASTAPLPLQFTDGDIQHHNLPLELYNWQELHDLEWHSHRGKCELGRDNGTGAGQYCEARQLGLAGLLGWKWGSFWRQ